MHSLADLVPVHHQRTERRYHEHGHEVVKQCGPGGDEADSVADREHARDSADQRRTTDPPDDTNHQRHQDDAEHCTAQSPAQAGVAEHRLAECNQLFADRRMHHQAEAGIVLHAVVVQHLPGLRGVVPRSPPSPTDGRRARHRQRVPAVQG